ncbi:hypothetical protein WJX84_007036 [Apatococcus fuscideae]|uniref:J domain-containing protein n=1 Tax=Apatococcus fuscideae TaxID=2026836 RepID=A0AAW1SRG6_9CHLO
MPKDPDHWSQVEDIDGQELYRILGLHPGASLDEIRQAFRALAKKLHPDKGGSARAFGRLQDAFRTLSDPKARSVYDDWAKELEFRYVRGVAGRAEGGEGVLLDDFANMGIHCDPATQLVVTCEVCRRPSNRECWTCGMKICEFCTLKRHWKDGFPLHWPLINSDHMRTRLAKREFEKKRLEDAQRLALQNPNHRTESELQDIRGFKAAAYEMLDRKDRLVTFDMRLARFYMWAQTDDNVYIAVRVPTGYEDKELLLDCNQSGINLQPEDSPPVIQRAFDNPVDASKPIESFRTKDNRMFTIALSKAQPGETWLRLFRGDSDGARCLEPPYKMSEMVDEVVLDFVVPFWIDSEDVKVAFRPKGISVQVRNTVSLYREYWTRAGDGRQAAAAAVDADNSTWSLDNEVSASGQKSRVLSILLARPPLTEDEIKWKKGVRQDNQSKERSGSMVQKGVRFFREDEDEFGLEDILQALCFLETGVSFVPSKTLAEWH